MTFLFYRYGYSHPGYDYTPPKFMFYPYSQHDIPSGFAHPQPLPEEQEPEPEQAEPQQPAVHHHSHNHEQVTSVTIEPSYSYELKPQTSYETQPQHTAPEQPQIDLPQEEAEGASHASAGYQEPVIVLRIPGPAKYAAHLQTLLQQYLEIRAAQYLSLLQEAEQHQQHQQPIYVPESDPPTAPGVPEQEPEPEHNLPITENNPRPTHTKVIFNPYPYQQQHEQHQQQQADDEEQHSEGERPFNYHAHSLKMRQGKRAAKPEPAAGDGGSGSESGDHRLQQIREYVREKLGAEMGSAVEYKTTQLLEG